MEQQQQPASAPVVARISKEEFEAMTPAERRVAVARDVIAQVRAEQFVAAPGIYLSAAYNLGEDGDWDEEDGLEGAGQEVLAQLPVCYGCGIGALMLTCVRKYNAFYGTLTHGFTQSAMRSYLAKYFSRKQLVLVEAAFEQRAGLALYNDPTAEVVVADVEAAAFWRPEIVEPNSRLTAIMQNIIDNGGEFRPGAAVPS